MKLKQPLLLLLLAFAGCQTTPKSEKTPADYSVPVNEEFTIELKANPSTGYTWRLSNAATVTKVVARGEKYTPTAHPTNLVGSGGIQKLRFKGVKKGIETLTFIYIRPWEKGAEPAQKKSFEVEVK